MSRAIRNGLFQQKWLWIMAMALLAMLYAGMIALALVTEYCGLSLVVLVFIFVIHLFELKYAIPIGKEKGFSKRHIVLMDLLFGFVWWLPVKWSVWKAKTD